LEYIPSLGINQTHQGIDVAATRGSPVQTPVHAVVNSVGYDATTGAGNFVVLGLDSGQTVHLYHLQDTVVKVGQDLSPGTLLGHVDSTGNSTGDHLHFEVQSAGKAIEPWTYFQEVVGNSAVTMSSTSSDPCAGVPWYSLPFCRIQHYGDSLGAAGNAVTGWGNVGAFASNALQPKYLWRVMFIGVGVSLIGIGVMIYFFDKEAAVVKVVAPMAAAA
jgi:hypothetical protein